jgi:hypothetical protein
VLGMDKSSLQTELNKLKEYLNKVKKNKAKSGNELLIRSYTITGMIETIYSLIRTGAYDAIDGSLDETFSLVNDARNLALHYGTSADFFKMSEKANEIVAMSPEEFDKSIAERINEYIKKESDDYLHVYKTDSVRITDSDSIHKDSFLIENLRTKEKIYVPREHLIILENRNTGDVSYLLKLTDDAKVYYKEKEGIPTSIVSLKELYKRKKLDNAYRGKPKLVKFDSVIAKMAKLVQSDPYSDLHFSYFYDGKNYYSKVYNVLSDYLQRHTMNERLALGKFQIKNASKIIESKEIEVPSLDKKELLNKATTKDLFYIELFLKEYNAYKEKTKDLGNDAEALYAKHALLLELYKNGPAYFSDKLINSNSDLATLFYSYRDQRNILSHSPINDHERVALIDNLERYNDALVEVLQPAYSLYGKDKRKYPHAYLPGTISIKDGKLLHNKMGEYNVYKHSGETLMLGGVKYLRLNYRDNPNLYIKVDGSLYVYNYYSESSYECIAPKGYTQIVEIDKNGTITPSKFNPLEGKEPILADFNQDSLFQAYNYLKHYPQSETGYFERKYNIRCAPIITINNAAGPYISDRLKNVIIRRNNQHFLARELLSACKCKIYDDIDKPIEILDKNNNIIATIYYGHVNKNGKITQVLSNGEEKEIEYGESVSRSLDTSEVIKEIKLERNTR